VTGADPLRVHFLGSGDAFGSGGRLQACILVEAAPGAVLLDCGATSLVAMKRAGVDPTAIEWLLVSHLHGDHFGGIPFLVLDGQFSRRTRPLVVAGPPGVQARVESAMDILFPGSAATQRKFELRFVEWRDREAAQLGPARVTPFAVDHASGAPAYALRVEIAGRVVAYSGDTAWCPSLAEAARGADLFIAEAYTFDRTVRYHLDFRTLMEHRAELSCRRIVLTHMSADMLSHLEGVDVEAAGDGLVLTVP
jgi:ribonuclease BN (tRNA processing enzyme)